LAVWETALSDPNAIEQIRFGVVLAVNGGTVTPSVGPASVRLVLVPLAVPGAITTAVPRFVDMTVSQLAFSVRE
jgi:hypothetical protein